MKKFISKKSKLELDAPKSKFTNFSSNLLENMSAILGGENPPPEEDETDPMHS